MDKFLIKVPSNKKPGTIAAVEVNPSLDEILESTPICAGEQSVNSQDPAKLLPCSKKQKLDKKETKKSPLER